MAKYVYTVRGNSGKIICVCSSKKKAVDKAIWYVKLLGESFTDLKLTDGPHYYEVEGINSSAEVEKFLLE